MQRNRSSKVVSLALVALFALVLAACGGTSSGNGGSDTNAGPPKVGGTLTVGLTAETDGWDPTNSQWADQGVTVASAIFDPLMAFGTDGKLHPYLAQSMTHNADFTQWTIKLRQGIKFQNGEPLNADAVVLQLKEDKASPLLGAALVWVKSITKVDDLTVRIDMTRPWAQFPAQLATQNGYIAAPAQLKATGSARTDHPIGTGPYIFQSWSRSDHLTVTKNPHYWRKGVGFAQQIIFRVITDPQAMLNSLQSGQVDVTFANTVGNVVQASQNSNLHVVERTFDVPNMIMLNMAKAPTDDLRVRQALAYATDAQEIIYRVDQGKTKQADGPYLPSSPWYAPSGYPMKPDVAKAEDLLNQYKEAKGISGKVKITLECVPSTANDQEMQLIEAQWEKVGFDVTRKSLEQSTYINDALLGNYEANCWSLLGAQDPDLDVFWMLSSSSNPPGQLSLNFPRLKDPKIDAAYQAAEATDDHAKRLAQYAIVWKQLAQQLPYLWLTHTFGAFVYSNKVHWNTNATLPDGSPMPLLKDQDITAPPIDQAWIG